MEDAKTLLNRSHRESGTVEIVHGNLKLSQLQVGSHQREADVLDVVGAASLRNSLAQAEQSAPEVDGRDAPYCASEQKHGLLSLPVDQYALALISYELITGQLPLASGEAHPSSSQGACSNLLMFVGPGSGASGKS
jgi:hypothetical protein